MRLVLFRCLALTLAMCLGVVVGAQPPRPAGGHPAQRIPTAADFPTGPAVGERLPEFSLPNQRGETIDFHADRAGARAAVLFQRSAVW